jgi:hypothetical protein
MTSVRWYLLRDADVSVMLCAKGKHMYGTPVYEYSYPTWALHELSRLDTLPKLQAHVLDLP